MDLDWAPPNIYYIYTPCFVLQCFMLYRWSPVQEKGGGSWWQGEELLVRSKRLLTDPLITPSLQRKEFTAQVGKISIPAWWFFLTRSNKTKPNKTRNVMDGLYACMLGFCRTLEIITRTLREVVNRVRLCGHHNPFEVFARWSACVGCDDAEMGRRRGSVYW